MAASTLSDALSGLNFSAGDTGWGVGAATLAGMAPKLINPYGSVGQNLGVGLGSVLLTALLQYQGKKEALASSLETTAAANDMMATTKTPEERANYVQNMIDQGADTNVVNRLSTLATALTQSDKEQAIANAARKDAVMQELYGKIALEKGIPFEEAPKWLQQRQDIIDRGNAIATGKPAGLPSQYMTQEEVKATRENLKEISSKLEKAQSEISTSQDYKDFVSAKNAYNAMINDATRNTEAGKQAAVLLFNRVLNPNNQVTLAEADSTGRADTVYNKFAGWWNGLSENEKGVRISSMSPEALKELTSIAKLTVDSLGKQYNSRVIGTVERLRSGPLPVPGEYANVSSVSPTGKLHLTSEENAKKSQEIDALNAKALQVAGSNIAEDVKKAAIEKAKQRIAEIQAELNDFE